MLRFKIEAIAFYIESSLINLLNRLFYFLANFSSVRIRLIKKLIRNGIFLESYKHFSIPYAYNCGQWISYTLLNNIKLPSNIEVLKY